jgi:YD repeat-containing protein
VPSGQSGAMSYDAAGNLTTDTYTSYGSRTYDAENRMTAAQDSFSGWSYYTYNADGQRVRRKINNQETWQVYGFDGELLAEYPVNGASASPQKEYGYRNGQLLITAEAPSAAFNGFTYQRSLTIDHSKVPDTDQSNFPVLISGPYSYLATVANGGKVQNANGYDVIFAADSSCNTKLNHEIESYSASTGAVNYWVAVPSVVSSTPLRPLVNRHRFRLVLPAQHGFQPSLSRDSR